MAEQVAALVLEDESGTVGQGDLSQTGCRAQCGRRRVGSCAIARRLRAPTDDPHLYRSGDPTSNGNAISAPPRCVRRIRRLQVLVFESEGGGLQRPPLLPEAWWWVPIPSCPWRPCASGCAPWSSLTAASRMPKFAPRTLDLDLLLYGELVCGRRWCCRAADPHQRLRALAAGGSWLPFRHPIDGRTIGGCGQVTTNLPAPDPIPFHWKAGELQHH